MLYSEPALNWHLQTVQWHRELNKLGMLSDNFTAGFFVSFIMTVFVPDIEGIQNKVTWLWIGKTCPVNIASMCSADLYDISRREPSRRAPNLKQPRAPKMKICLCPECTTVSADLGRTVNRKSSIGGLHVFVGGLDILKKNFNSQHKQHLQIVQINYKKFPANAHNRLVVSNKNFCTNLTKGIGS